MPSGMEPRLYSAMRFFHFKKLGDRLRFNADFDTPQTGQQEIHLITEAGGAAQVFGRGLHHFWLAFTDLEQAPARRELLGTDQSSQG